MFLGFLAWSGTVEPWPGTGEYEPPRDRGLSALRRRSALEGFLRDSDHEQSTSAFGQFQGKRTAYCTRITQRTTNYKDGKALILC